MKTDTSRSTEEKVKGSYHQEYDFALKVDMCLKDKEEDS